LAVAYVVHRDLHGRYQAYQRSEESVQAAQHKEQALEDEKQRLEQRVKDLDQNPLEVEAAIRRIKRLVRDGETVYRLEEAPETAAPAQE
jgi:cell division protein FtsB